MACPRRNSSIAQSPLLRPPLPAMMLPVGGSMTSDQNRRKFLGNAAATAAAFTIVPRHVLGGPGVVAPSDKITLAYIGTGTQGLREMPKLIANPEIRIVAVCDPSKHAIGYRDWGRDDLLNELRKAVGKPDWMAGT